MKTAKPFAKRLTALIGIVWLTGACGVQPSNDSNSLQSGSSVPKQDEVLSSPIVNDEITSTISSKLKEKCKEMFADSATEQANCSRASDDLARELDFDYIRRKDGNSAFVFLSKRLKSLLAQPETSQYLNELQKASLDAIYANKPLNLWDFTLEQSSGREDLATERLAVLFQDGAQTAAQRKYLLVAQHPMAFVLANSLELLEKGLVQGKIAAYPKSVNSSRTALYHYYVPRLLASRLRAGRHSEAMSARLPSIFNALYELRQIQKAENPQIGSAHKPVAAGESDSPAVREFVAKWNKFDELYSDLIDHLSAPLLPFNPAGQDDNLNDLYLGYAGALQGTKKAEKPISFSDFTANFAKNPSYFLKHNSLKSQP
ncbi:MAG: hypothetical protein EBR09_13915 [Proteobacteria bacterium]|nr:hypothetical protein [Pseudomonadota bacterium]